MTEAFHYVVWILDPTQPEDYCCREWVACFLIEASDAAAALAWGDRVSADYGARTGQQILSSSVEEPDEAAWRQPMIVAGQPADDSVIGW